MINHDHMRRQTLWEDRLIDMVFHFQRSDSVSTGINFPNVGRVFNVGLAGVPAGLLPGQKAGKRAIYCATCTSIQSFRFTDSMRWWWSVCSDVVGCGRLVNKACRSQQQPDIDQWLLHGSSHPGLKISKQTSLWQISMDFFVPNARIAKIDATANDVDGVDIEGFPTIKFWRADNKERGICSKNHSHRYRWQ